MVKQRDINAFKRLFDLFGDLDIGPLRFDIAGGMIMNQDVG